MLERIPETKKIFEDPKHAAVRKALEAAIRKQAILLAGLMRRTEERQSESRVHFFAREIFIRQVNGAKLSPEIFSRDLVGFANEVGQAWESLPPEQILVQDKNGLFSPPLQRQKNGRSRHHPVSPIDAFTVSRDRHVDNPFGRVATNLGCAIKMANDAAKSRATLKTLSLAVSGRIKREVAMEILQKLDPQISSFTTENGVVVCEYGVFKGKLFYPNLEARLTAERQQEYLKLVCVSSFLTVGFSDQI